jgi:hypothetical protein
LNKIVHPNTDNNAPEEIGCLITLYIPDVIRFDFFLTLGIAPILKNAETIKIHPETKSNIPVGSESTLLILNLLCGIMGATNNGPTTTKTNNF